MRLAAVADIHITAENHERDVRQFSAVNDLADVLVIAGDFTNHGMPEEMRAVLGVLDCIRIPSLRCSGTTTTNVDTRTSLPACSVSPESTCSTVSATRSMVSALPEPRAFAAASRPYELMPFGEQGIKTFVEVAEREAVKLDYGLAQTQAEKKVAITHYAPIKETIVGEPEPIFPFLGSSRLERALETHRPVLALHGHAHKGTFSAETKSGIRVCNVALPVLRQRGEEHPFALFNL